MSSFYRLAPFIQEWVYRQGWQELRPVQVEACKVIFETEAHLLLATGTASGKTEAALLPTITLLEENPSSSIGILYIGPLKALINDQFSRVEDLLKEADIPVWRWHGDVPQNHKQKLLKNPKGILQITPESLESMLINKTAEIRRVFGDLRFIVVDEVHSFMSSDRGRQLICQLERIGRLINYQPRRIGLSATLGDYTLAEEWLASGTDVKVITPAVPGEKKKVRLAVENFMEPEYNTMMTSGGNLLLGPDLPSHKYIFDLIKDKKCIIFSNTREVTELVTNGLRELAKIKGFPPERILIHHSSLATFLRESAEKIMKEQANQTIAATLTLELGMDIGDVERIIHLQAPHAVFSFVQRLGRSGRRTNASEMVFTISENPLTTSTPFERMIPWYLLQTVAIIQLYLEEQWIEPPRTPKCPYSLLYHQTMSILASIGELTPQALAQQVLTLPPFKHVTQDDFRDLLRHLLAINHIQSMEDGGLIVGLEGEKIVRNFRFYAVFRDYGLEYSVKEGAKEIGQIADFYPPGTMILLGGNVYEVKEVYSQHKIMIVERKPKRTVYVWPGRRPPTHTRILQKMQRILFEDVEYGYLQEGAMKRIEMVRKFARTHKLDKKVIHKVGGKNYVIFPWMGTWAFRTLHRILRFNKDAIPIEKLKPIRLDPAPYFIKFEAEETNVESLQNKIVSLCKQIQSVEQLVDPSEIFIRERYDHFLPQNLQQKFWMSDYLDLDEVKFLVGKW
ncbi:MAG: DEAD/DEAH box helicase [Promethearchaeota archaeon]